MKAIILLLLCIFHTAAALEVTQIRRGLITLSDRSVWSVHNSDTLKARFIYKTDSVELITPEHRDVHNTKILKTKTTSLRVIRVGHL